MSGAGPARSGSGRPTPMQQLGLVILTIAFAIYVLFRVAT
jgi:hypothetical protein